MNYRNLLFKIIGCLVVVALVVGAGVGWVLYREAIQETEAVLSDLARTGARLIDAMAEAEDAMRPHDGMSFKHSETLAQVRDAFSELGRAKSFHEIHLVAAQGDDVLVLVSQGSPDVPKPNTVLSGQTGFAKAMKRGLAGEYGLAHVTGPDGRLVILAVAPVPTLKAAVVVETRLISVTEPFVHAALFGLLAGALVIGLGAAFTYSQAVPMIQGATETSEKLRLEQAAAERARNQLEASLECLTEGFALFDSDDRLVICNKVFRDDYESSGISLVPGVAFEDMLRTRAAAGAYVDESGGREAAIRRRLERHRNPAGSFEKQMSDGRWLLISEHRTWDGGTVGNWTDVTDLKRKEAALAAAGREAEDARKLLEDALQTIGEGFALYDRDDRLIMFNEKYGEMYEGDSKPIRLGVTFEELLRDGVAAGVYAEALEHPEEWIRRRLAVHRDPVGTMEQKLTDGRWLLVTERRTHDGGTVGVRTDITELKRKEQELRESRQRFRDFTETASDWVWETNADHRFILANPTADDAFGKEFANTVGKTRWEMAAEDTATEKWRRHRDDLENHRPFRNFAYRIVDASGKARYGSVSGRPVFDSSGRFTGYRGTATDVTDLRAQEEYLESLEERFRIAFDNVTVAIILIDERGTILDFNPAASKVFGYGAEEIIGANVRVLMPEPDRGQHDSYLQSYLETGQRKVIGIGREVVGLRKNGETFPMFLGVAEIKVRGQRQFIGSVNDLTPVRSLELQLRQAQKMETVGQMVGGIAHDFNNLLGIIIGNLDLVRRKIDAESRAFLQIEKAMGAANRGAALTRRLLNFSRTAPTASEPVDINAAIRNVQDMIQRSITKNIDVRLMLANALPAAVVDPGDLDDSLVNLAVNARDAMPDGGILSIETSLRTVVDAEDAMGPDLAPGDYIQIDVTDTGSGIAKDELPRIFDPFFSTKEKDKGTGLGLAMVYGFVRRSGGRITVYSEVGIGTTFKLFLPVAAQGGDISQAVKAPAAEVELPRGSERILVVDDEADLAEVAATFLGELGYTVLIAHSGPEAMTIIDSPEPIDLMLSDVIMPGGMTGFDLAEEAMRHRPGLRICLASGFTGEMVSGKDSRAARYPLLRKPFSNRDLARQVRHLLDAAT